MHLKKTAPIHFDPTPATILRGIRMATATLLVTSGLALAQHPVEGPRQSGGGIGGVGISIDLGSIFNAIKNATNKNDEPTKPPVLQKSAVNIGSGSSGNYIVDWVVQYANNTGAPQSGVIVRDGPIATIIPGSLQQPPGWVGATNGNVPVDNWAQWTGATVPPHGVMTAPFPPPHAANITVAGTGDGYQPIPYAKSSLPAGPRIYAMNHHQSPGALSFSCIDVATGLGCAPMSMSGTWPRILPAGDSSANSSGTTTNNMEYVIDSGKLYYASMGAAGAGIGCFNLETETECGFTRFLTSATNIQGPWRIGNELYVASYDGSLFCANLSNSMGTCSGGNYKIPATDFAVHTTQGNSAWTMGFVAGKVGGPRLYITSVQMGGGQKYTNCFDSVTKKACWSTTLPTRGTSAFNYPSTRANVSNFLYYDTANIPVAICTMELSPAPSQTCVDLATGAQKSGLPAVLPGLALGAGLETHLADKTYFVATTFQADTRADSWCWNWTTQSACNAQPNGKIAIGPVSPRNYATNADDQGCIWVYGDASKLWHFDPGSIDPATGLAKPCGGSGKFVKTFLPLTYCSGPKPFHWTSVEIKGAPLGNYDKFTVNVLDSTANTVLLTKDLKAAGSSLADISSLDGQTLGKPLKIEIEYTPKPGMGAADKPVLEVRYNAPPPEFCFKSTHTCKQDKITNIVETPDPANPGKIISVKVDVNKPQVCPVIDPPPPVCGQPGQPPCPCVAGTPGCQPPPPPPVCAPGSPLWPSCMTCAYPPCIGTPPPPPRTNLCLTGDCPDKPQQSVAEEYKAPKVACVRKPKPAEEPKKVTALKPRPKMAMVTPPVVMDANAPQPPPKPKPKPRPKTAKSKPVQEDDCE